MINEIFIFHPVKSFLRNRRLRNNLVSYCLFILVILFFIYLLLIFGSNINEILSEQSNNPIGKFNSLIAWYLIIDLIIRSVLKSAPKINLIPYLRYAISRRKIVNYILLINIFDFFNFISLFVIIPFSWGTVYNILGFRESVSYQFFLTVLILINCYIASYIRLGIQKRIFLNIIPIGLALSLFFILPFRTLLDSISILIGNLILEGSYFFLFILLSFLIIIVILLRRKYLLSFYLDDQIVKINRHKNTSKSISKDIVIFETPVKNHLLLEIKLLIRNRRPLQTISTYPLFPIFILINIINKDLNSFASILSILFLLGLFPILYGQNIFNWESTYFDGKMARKLTLCKYLYAKYYLLLIFSTFVFLIILCVFIMFNKSPLLLISMFLFVNGFLNLVILIFGTLNNSRINLNEHFFLNYQGLNTIQLILPVVILIFPALLFTIISSISSYLFTLLLFGSLGLILMIIHKIFIKRVILLVFRKRKYVNLEGYRKFNN
jgi:hypothetical protein